MDTSNDPHPHGPRAVSGPATAATLRSSTRHDLRTPTLRDAHILRAAFASLDEPISDATVTQTLSWASPLGTLLGVIRGHACLFASADGDLSMILAPLPTTPGALTDLDAALRDCFAVMDAHNEPCGGVSRSRLEYVCEQSLERIRAAGPFGASLSASPMPGDYVYDRVAMATLDGGQLKGKRKLRNRFEREHPDAVCAPITPADVPDCITLLHEWAADGDDRHEGDASDLLIGADELRSRDVAATTACLELIGPLGLPSMLVRSRGVLVGFTIGEWLTPTTASVIVEKTKPGVAGAPQFIYSAFCAGPLQHATQINAGDDCGIASLAFTKASYRPIRLRSKLVLTRQAVVDRGLPSTDLVQTLRLGRPAHVAASAPTDAPRQAHIRAADLADAFRIGVIEDHAFTDPNDRFSPRQIRSLIRNPRARVAVAEDPSTEGGGDVVGWAVALIRRHRRWRSGRVYGVAVDPAHAGHGLGRALLEHQLQSLHAEGITRVYLEVRADNHAACTLYESVGFKTIKTLDNYYGPNTHGLRMRLLTG